MSFDSWLHLDPEYTEDEVNCAMRRLGGRLGGTHGFEFTHENTTQELEDIRREERLEAAGFKTGTVQELLDLSDDDVEAIESRIVNARLRGALNEERERCAQIAEDHAATAMCGLCGGTIASEIRALIRETVEDSAEILEGLSSDRLARIESILARICQGFHICPHCGDASRLWSYPESFDG